MSATNDSNAAATSLEGRRLHFVGIGGCGMSGLARIARRAGAVCTGSDHAPSDTITALRGEGFNVSLEQTTDTVPADSEVLVISAAIGDTHPEVVEATRRGMRVVKYARMLGELMVGRTGVAVAGTHGKSSTTSLLSHTLISAGLDPSVIVGANCPQIGGGWRVGKSDILVAEACEYDRSFHNLHPTHGLVLNVEEDHMEIYHSIDAIVDAFRSFAQLLPADGSLLIGHDQSHRLAITAGLACDVQTLGFSPQADWRVSVADEGDAAAGPPRVTLFEKGKAVASWLSPLPGDHMAYNAAAAAVTAHRLGADWDAVAHGIETFAGLDRRMQRLGTRPAGDGVTGEAGDVTVVDDYGHHPTEIDTTLRALRRHYRPQRLICVFQPHQHSRTRFLMDQFATSFSEADLIIVPDIYFVRDSEQERQEVRAAELVERLRRRGQKALHMEPLAAIAEHLAMITRPGDLVVTMGAGNVWEVARAFLAA